MPPLRAATARLAALYAQFRTLWIRASGHEDRCAGDTASAASKPSRARRPERRTHVTGSARREGRRGRGADATRPVTDQRARGARSDPNLNQRPPECQEKNLAAHGASSRTITLASLDLPDRRLHCSRFTPATTRPYTYHIYKVRVPDGPSLPRVGRLQTTTAVSLTLPYLRHETESEYSETTGPHEGPGQRRAAAGRPRQ